MLPLITGLIGLGVLGVVVLFAIRPDSDNTVLITLVTVFIGSGIGHILTYAKSQETHAVVNSRMDEFKAALERTAQEAADLAYARGRADGRVLGAEAADKRTDAIAQGQKDGQ